MLAYLLLLKYIIKKKLLLVMLMEMYMLLMLKIDNYRLNLNRILKLLDRLLLIILNKKLLHHLMTRQLLSPIFRNLRRNRAYKVISKKQLL